MAIIKFKYKEIMIHFHKYKFIRIAGKSRDVDSGYLYTQVIFGCEKCDKVKSKLIKGNFELEDFIKFKE